MKTPFSPFPTVFPSHLSVPRTQLFVTFTTIQSFLSYFPLSYGLRPFCTGNIVFPILSPFLDRFPSTFPALVFRSFLPVSSTSFLQFQETLNSPCDVDIGLKHAPTSAIFSSYFHVAQIQVLNNIYTFYYT